MPVFCPLCAARSEEHERTVQESLCLGESGCVDQEGVFHPRYIRWENGLIFQIDRILYKCRASSKKVVGGGIRYTVLIRGRESYLFQEGSKWFVEAKET